MKICSRVQVGKYLENFLLRMAWSKESLYCHCFSSLL